VISNVNLTRPDLATEEDERYGLDEWCRFFKATSWEELKMLAKNNTVMEKAVSGVSQLTEEEIIRQKCRAREEWIINDKWKTDTIARLSDENAELSEKNAELSDKNAELSDKNAEQFSIISRMDEELKTKDSEIETLRQKLEELEKRK
jgi:hypothetical protein